MATMRDAILTHSVEQAAKAAKDASVLIRPLDTDDERTWWGYVLEHPGGTVFHDPAWSWAVEQAYAHCPCHLGAFLGEHMVGVLPLFLVKSVFVGKVLVSVPYAAYGGILADSLEVSEMLLVAAADLRERLGCRYVELRHRDPSDLELPELDNYDTFREPLPGRAEEVLSELPGKARAAARRGLELLGEDAAITGRQHLDAIYELYALTMRRLGLPNYRRGFWGRLAESYGEDFVCLVVRDRERPVAGVVSLVFRDEIVACFSGSTPEGVAKNADSVMYLRLMEYAVRRGLRWFDFNRTRRDDQGAYDFKRYHGFPPTPLHYQFSLAAGTDLPTISPSDRRSGLATWVWRHLPLRLTRWASGRVTRWTP